MLTQTTKRLIHEALKEDIGTGDLTTRLLVPNSLKGEALILSNSAGILCGGPVVKEVFRVIDPGLRLKQFVPEGGSFRKGEPLFLLRGKIPSILKGERVSLNFLARLSGIATLTKTYVVRVKGTQAKIYDTRKTTPAWRELEKYAVRSGGGQNHRFGLWDEILVKDNHWFAVEKVTKKDPRKHFDQKLSKTAKKIPVEIEIDNLGQLKHLLAGKFLPHRILLDNFTLGDLKKAVHLVKKVKKKISIEASGGITLQNLRQVAKTGVHRISVGALTHSAPAVDLSLAIKKINFFK